MHFDGKDFPTWLVMFAFCGYAVPENDMENDLVHENHLYRVLRFVKEDGFFPYGVRVADYKGNELEQTFYMQRFSYFECCLN